MSNFTFKQYERAEEIMGKKNFVCEHCNTRFTVDDPVILNDRYIFCSAECLGEWMLSDGEAIEYTEFIEYIDEEVETL